MLEQCFVGKECCGALEMCFENDGGLWRVFGGFAKKRCHFCNWQFFLGVNQKTKFCTFALCSTNGRYATGKVHWIIRIVSKRMEPISFMDITNRTSIYTHNIRFISSKHSLTSMLPVCCCWNTIENFCNFTDLNSVNLQTNSLLLM